MKRARPEYAAIYEAVIATAVLEERVSIAVPLGDKGRNTVQARIRSYLADRGYRLHATVESGILWCRAERVG